MACPRPIILIILDGWGINPQREANAITLANPPFYRHLLETYPHTTLSASGEDVGLPAGQMGNSEVGHMNIGAGKIVYQDFTRINKAITDHSFHANPTLLKGISPLQGQSLHLMGLLSDGGVHSHINHLLALLEMAKTCNVQSLIVHPFLDGRDTPPQSSLQYVETLERALKAAPPGASWQIGTVMGRYYAMDRDARWDRTQKAYEAMVVGKGNRAESASTAIQESFTTGQTDEFVLPTVIYKNEHPVGLVSDNDCILFYNFRADRARQLTRALADPTLNTFERIRLPPLTSFVTMTPYHESFSFPIAFPPLRLDSGILADVLSKRGLTQLRLAETEKYAHVTYFFNGGREAPFEGETRILIPSPKNVATYDQIPQMSAEAVTEEAIRQIETGSFDFILINFANPDMVGHSGNLKAAIEAVSVVDRCLKKIVHTTLGAGGATLITADHGNLEQMIDYETREPHTAHTTLPVPFIFVASDDRLRGVHLRPGIHANIAPTILHLMGIQKPLEMDQESLMTGA